MKKIIITSILIALLGTGTALMAQDRQEESLGLPGDNLNLYAVMNLFQKSETLEGFERNLNEQNSNVNNLDLDGDNMVDYIRVLDFVDGDVHNIVLQVAINERENQDVAVFTVQRTNDGNVYIQLIGDEALYGRDYIIEPIFDEGGTLNPGYTGNNRRINRRNNNVNRITTFEIAAWPVVRFIYMPAYVGWRSSWYYGYYPSYWHSWQPYYWDYYYGYHYNWYNDYYSHYRHTQYHRYTGWNDFYYNGRRSYSTNVSGRIRAGNYKSTYSRPDQRKDGAALFTKMHPEQNSRRSYNSSGNSTVRRSATRQATDRQSSGTVTNQRSTGTRQATERQSTGTVTNRRSTGTVTNRSESKPASGRSTGTTRRNTRTETNKSESQPNGVQNAGTNRSESRPAGVQNAGTNRSESRPASVQNSGTNRSESRPAGVQNSGTNRSESRPASVENARTTRRSATTATSRSESKPESGKSSTNVTSSNRRSSSRSETTVRQGGSIKETGTAKPARKR